jgi:hypothetical protein
MPQLWNLGNDIVDLADPRHGGKAGDGRFLQRVFSQGEQDEILSSPDPERALWIRWAGKEAAFKTVSKALGSPPTFVHSSFQVSLLPLEPGAGEDEGGAPLPPMTRFGEVHYKGDRVPLRIEVADGTLHAITWFFPAGVRVPPFSWGFKRISGEDPSWRESLRPGFSPAEWRCVTHRPSALVRLAVRESLASALDVQEERLQVGCGPGAPGRRIPRVFLDGKEVSVDLSLSHHGELVAWAFVPQSQGR